MVAPGEVPADRVHDREIAGESDREHGGDDPQSARPSETVPKYCFSGVYNTASWSATDPPTASASQRFERVGVSRSHRTTYSFSNSRTTKPVNTIVIAYGVIAAAPSSA
ncbi:hypothetical protein SY89_00580 [Halolamina pelagica]|uniref:Uncharacterized protein n=1 Tax=Halolamina pelagica TaxID=699431 RepID=A0A0P7HZP9_9EURY|nr:hypothetical protein SY89_00580 [Halolamina pelagica]